MSKDGMALGEEINIIKSNPQDSTSSNDGFKWTSNGYIEKYNNNESLANGIPDEITKIEGNTGLLIGINALWKMINGQTGVYFLNSDNAVIGVGDSSAIAASNQAGLLGVNKAYTHMDNATETYPSIQGNIMTLRAKFGPTDANFTWNEWGVLNGSPTELDTDRELDSVIQFNRKVEPMGTKSEGSTWIAVVNLSINP